jgi:hypothetical protein
MRTHGVLFNGLIRPPAPHKFNTFNIFNTFNTFAIFNHARVDRSLSHGLAPRSRSLSNVALRRPCPLSQFDGSGAGVRACAHGEGLSEGRSSYELWPHRGDAQQPLRLDLIAAGSRNPKTAETKATSYLASNDALLNQA